MREEAEARRWKAVFRFEVGLGVGYIGCGRVGEWGSDIGFG